MALKQHLANKNGLMHAFVVNFLMMAQILLPASTRFSGALIVCPLEGESARILHPLCHGHNSVDA